MGFTSRKTGNFKEAENYYLKGLELDPKHRGERRITTFCRRGDVKANQLDDDPIALFFRLPRQT